MYGGSKMLHIHSSNTNSNDVKRDKCGIPLPTIKIRTGPVPFLSFRRDVTGYEEMARAGH